MVINTVVSVFILVAMAGFFALSLWKASKIARMQMHPRLDLYPIPTEGAERTAHGGSYLEEPEWWTKPRKTDEVYAMREVLIEMLFIKKLFQNQRSLWWASYALHLGIYVMLGWSVLLLLSVFWHPTAYVLLVDLVGAVGFALATAGCLLLLVRRTTDDSLEKYTTPQEYFNIMLLLTVLMTGAYCWLFITSPTVVAIQVFTLSAVNLPIAILVHLSLLGIMFLYIPLSKMGHYVAKYFSFRKVLWDNVPNMPGNAVDRKLKEAEAQAAPANWASLQASDVASETKEG